MGASTSDGDPLRAGFWPYMTPSRGAALRPEHTTGGIGPPGFDPTHYLYERYATGEGGGLRRIYYLVRPALPRRAQLAMRRLYSQRQRSRAFPRWPAEPLLVDRQYDHMRGRLADEGAERFAFVNFWPDGKRFCTVLTHDVEGAAGIREIPRILEVEQRHGFRSSWNFVAEDYRIPEGTFEQIRAAGGEVGLHGITHDGKLFASSQAVRSRPPEDPSVPGRLEGGGLSLARAASQRRLDAGNRQRVRHLLPGHRSVRAAGGRLLLDLPLLPRRHGRASGHARPGPHALRDPA